MPFKYAFLLNGHKIKLFYNKFSAFYMGRITPKIIKLLKNLRKTKKRKKNFFLKTLGMIPKPGELPPLPFPVFLWSFFFCLENVKLWDFTSLFLQQIFTTSQFWRQNIVEHDKSLTRKTWISYFYFFLVSQIGFKDCNM